MEQMTESRPLLEVRNLTKRFAIKKQRFPWQKKNYIYVLNGIDFSINKGEALGLVGESGCGKSTTAKLIMDIYRPTTGAVSYDSYDLLSLKGKERKKIRRNIQYVFQDPMGALNPRIPVIEQIYEPLEIHYGRDRKRHYKKAVELLEAVGMKESHGKMYPHQISGGQRQRVVLARAMILEPDILICDEPISALDVSIQAQVVNLLIKIRKDRGITLLFISHDLSMVRHLCNTTAVMYMGDIIEYGSSEALFDQPMHPYSVSLITAIPIPDPRVKREEQIVEGELPGLLNPPSGCRFHPRCLQAMPLCSKSKPVLKLQKDGRKAACFALEKGGVT